MEKILQLSLKKEWFGMTQSGIKTEDYRDLTPYWYSRLCLYRGIKKSQNWWEEYFKYAYSEDQESRISFIDFSQNKMTLGYPKSDDNKRILIYEHKSIRIGTGNPEWGAEPDKLYFIIKHGASLTPNN